MTAREIIAKAINSRIEPVESFEGLHLADKTELLDKADAVLIALYASGWRVVRS